MVPKFGDRLIVMIEQGGTVERTFNAINGTIDTIEGELGVASF